MCDVGGGSLVGRKQQASKSLQSTLECLDLLVK